jgi:hypothetical protein
MAFQTFMKFPQKIDVHYPTNNVSAAGQMTPSFYFKDTISAHISPGAHERDVSPYIKEMDQYHIQIPKHFDGIVTYQSRLFNIRDKYDNVIEAGPLEITSIMKWTGHSGSIHHLHVTAKVVVEVQ